MQKIPSIFNIQKTLYLKEFYFIKCHQGIVKIHNVKILSQKMAENIFIFLNTKMPSILFLNTSTVTYYAKEKLNLSKQ